MLKIIDNNIRLNKIAYLQIELGDKRYGTGRNEKSKGNYTVIVRSDCLLYSDRSNYYTFNNINILWTEKSLPNYLKVLYYCTLKGLTKFKLILNSKKKNNVKQNYLTPNIYVKQTATLLLLLLIIISKVKSQKL